MSFQINDRVVCVDNGPFRNPRHLGRPSGLVKGRIYVVLGFSYNGGLLIVGKSTGLKCINAPGEVGWIPERFRKLDDLKAESRERYYREHPEAQPVS